MEVIVLCVLGLPLGDADLLPKLELLFELGDAPGEQFLVLDHSLLEVAEVLVRLVLDSTGLSLDDLRVALEGPVQEVVLSVAVVELSAVLQQKVEVLAHLVDFTLETLDDAFVVLFGGLVVVVDDLHQFVVLLLVLWLLVDALTQVLEALVDGCHTLNAHLAHTGQESRLDLVGLVDQNLLAVACLQHEEYGVLLVCADILDRPDTVLYLLHVAVELFDGVLLLAGFLVFGVLLVEVLLDDVFGTLLE